MKDAVSTHLNEHHRFEPVHPPAMSETPSSGEETVTIRVFSPSHEVPQRLVIPDIPVSLTLFDLKQRISAQIPIRPPPNVQRLICRGRILVGDDRKIGTVLDPQSQIQPIHLVLPPPDLLPKPTDIPPESAASSSSIQTSNAEDGPADSILRQRNGTPQDTAQQMLPGATSTTRISPDMSENAHNQLRTIRDQIGFLRERNAAMVHDTNSLNMSGVTGDMARTAAAAARTGNLDSPIPQSAVAEDERRDSLFEIPSSPAATTTTATPSPADIAHTPLSNSATAILDTSPETTHQQRIEKFTILLERLENQARNNVIPSIQEMQDAELQAQVLLASERRHIQQAPHVALTPVSALLKRLSDTLSTTTERRNRGRRASSMHVDTSVPEGFATTASATAGNDNEHIQGNTTHTPIRERDSLAPETLLYLVTSPDGSYRALLVPGRDLVDLQAQVRVHPMQGSQASATVQSAQGDTPTNTTNPMTQPPSWSEGVHRVNNHNDFFNQTQPQSPPPPPPPQPQPETQPQTQAHFPAPGAQGNQRQPHSHGYIVIMFNAQRVLRRLWLFIRLYFLSYLITNDDTWQRIFFLWISAALAYFSDSDVSNWAYETFARPILAHFENLVPLDHRLVRRQRGAGDERGQAEPRAQAQAQAGGGEGGQRAAAAERDAAASFPIPPSGADNIPALSRTAPAANTSAESTAPTQLTGFQRFERGIALFAASLIPGIGERHVAAVNEANAQIERERRDEQAVQQQQ